MSALSSYGMPSTASMESPIALKYSLLGLVVAQADAQRLALGPAAGRPPARPSRPRGRRCTTRRCPASPPGTAPGTTHESAGLAWPHRAAVDDALAVDRHRDGLAELDVRPRPLRGTAGSPCRSAPRRAARRNALGELGVVPRRRGQFGRRRVADVEVAGLEVRPRRSAPAYSVQSMASIARGSRPAGSPPTCSAVTADALMPLGDLERAVADGLDSARLDVVEALLRRSGRSPV